MEGRERGKRQRRLHATRARERFFTRAAKRSLVKNARSARILHSRPIKKEAPPFRVEPLFFNGRAVWRIDEPSQVFDYIDIYSLPTQLIIPEAVRLYQSGLTLREVSKELGISKTKVRATLILQDVVLRPPNGPEQKRIPKSKRLHTGVTPYGYTRLQGNLVVDPKEIVVVRLILRLRQSGKTLWDIANHLTSQGYKNRSGTAWEHSLVRNVINRHKDGLAEVENQIRLSIESKGKNL